MIIFENDGLINERAIRTFGVNVKENDSAIGYFGTGLKYAIAIILREGGSITIYRGRRAINFQTKKSVIRGKQFGIITMDGQELGFTTDLGKDWETWMAFRELYCNAKDEGGSTYSTGEKTAGEEGKTRIVVTGAGFEEHWNNRHKIFLATKPMETVHGVEIHSGKSDFAYYRGIRALKLSRPSLYTYNIVEKMELTEERQIKYPHYMDTHLLFAALDTSLERYLCDFLTAKEEYLEAHVSFHHSSSKPSDLFMKVVSRFRDEKMAFSESARTLFVKYAERYAGSGNDLVFQANFIQKQTIYNAVKKINKLGFPVTEGEIRCVSDIHGDYDYRLSNGVINLHQRCLNYKDAHLQTVILRAYSEMMAPSGLAWLAAMVITGDLTEAEIIAKGPEEDAA